MNAINAANIELLIFTILLLLLLFVFNLRYWKPRIINPLSLIYIIAVASCICEILAYCADGQPEYAWRNYLFTILYMSFLVLMSISWLVYCNLRFPKKIMVKPSHYYLRAIPMLIEIVALASAPVTGLIFHVDERGFYHRTSTFFIQLMPYMYLAATTVLGLYWYKKAETTKERNEYLAIAIFAIPPFILGGIQVLSNSHHLDTTQISVVFALLANYAVAQNNRITRDSTTRLPNREVLDTVLAESIRNQQHGSKDKLFVMMCDLDGFKQINDTYGHIEGDRALIRTADALYQIAKSHKGTAARFGGDEFTIVVEAPSEEVPLQIIKEIDQTLQDLSRGEPYMLKMSVGYTLYRPSDTVPDILKAADRELYRIKHEHKTARI